MSLRVGKITFAPDGALSVVRIADHKARHALTDVVDFSILECFGIRFGDGTWPKPELNLDALRARNQEVLRRRSRKRSLR